MFEFLNLHRENVYVFELFGGRVRMLRRRVLRHIDCVYFRFVYRQ